MREREMDGESPGLQTAGWVAGFPERAPSCHRST